MLSTADIIIPNKLRESLKLLHLRPALHILKQKAVILTTCRIVRIFFGRQWIKSAWSVDPYSFENVYRRELQVTNADTADFYDQCRLLKKLWQTSNHWTAHGNRC